MISITRYFTPVPAIPHVPRFDPEGREWGSQLAFVFWWLRLPLWISMWLGQNKRAALIIGLGSLMGVCWWYWPGISEAYSTEWVWLYRWQTLIGSSIATLAAAGTVYFVRQQVQEQRRQFEDQRRAKHEASRAMLPIYANDVIAHAQDCVWFWTRVVANHSNTDKPSSFARDKLKQIADLAAILSHDDGGAEAILEIVKRLQYLDARIESYNGSRYFDLTYGVSNICEWVEVHVWASRLILFGRWNIVDHRWMQDKIDSGNIRDEESSNSISILREYLVSPLPKPIDVSNYLDVTHGDVRPDYKAVGQLISKRA